LGFTEQEANPTAANLLQKESPPEDRPECLLWGTRDSLQRGGKALYAASQKAQRKPKFSMEGLAFQAKAFGDQWNSLGTRQCHVIRDGQEVTGKAGNNQFHGREEIDRSMGR